MASNSEDADLACQNPSDWENQFFFAEIGDKTNENNGHESDKENEEEKEETEEEIILAKALEMIDTLKIYYLGKGIADVHSQGSEIEDKIMNFSTQISSSLQWYHIVTNLYLPHSSL